MKTVGMEQTSLRDCVSQARKERLILTDNGQPVALVIGIDKDQMQLGQDASFWKLIEHRRGQRAISRKELEKSWPEE